MTVNTAGREHDRAFLSDKQKAHVGVEMNEWSLKKIIGALKLDFKH